MAKYPSEYLRVNLRKKGPEFYEQLSVNTDPFAYDLSENTFSIGEVIDYKAINMSIKNIILTTFGNLLFEPGIGSTMIANLFEGITAEKAEDILDNLINDILRIETRITIDSSATVMNIYHNKNSIEISIPYVINSTGIESVFKQNISV